MSKFPKIGLYKKKQESLHDPLDEFISQEVKIKPTFGNTWLCYGFFC